MEAFLFGWAIAALVGVLIAESKNRGKGEGLALGCLLGPIGWLIEALLPSKEEKAPATREGSSTGSSGGGSTSSSGRERPKRKCPHCAEIILLEANVCKHCGRDVDGSPEARREAALKALERLEREHETGKLSDEEYRRQKNKYARAAVEARHEEEGRGADDQGGSGGVDRQG